MTYNLRQPAAMARFLSLKVGMKPIKKLKIESKENKEVFNV